MRALHFQLHLSLSLIDSSFSFLALSSTLPPFDSSTFPPFHPSTLPPFHPSTLAYPQTASPPTKAFAQVGSPRTTHPLAQADASADRGTTAVPAYKPTVSSYTGAAFAGVKPSWPPAANSSGGGSASASGRGPTPIVATTGAVSSSCVLVVLDAAGCCCLLSWSFRICFIYVLLSSRLLLFYRPYFPSSPIYTTSLLPTPLLTTPILLTPLLDLTRRLQQARPCRRQPTQRVRRRGPRPLQQGRRVQPDCYRVQAAPTGARSQEELLLAVFVGRAGHRDHCHYHYHRRCLRLCEL